MSFTLFGMDRLLRWFSGLSPTLPANLWVAGFTSISNVQTGAGTEPSGNGYARIQFANTGVNWLDPAQGTPIGGLTPVNMLNETNLNGGTLTVQQTFTHVGLFDAATGGNCWYCVQLTSPVVIPAGQTWRLPAQALTIQLIRSS